MSTAVVPMSLLVPKVPPAPPCKEFLIFTPVPYTESVSPSLSTFWFFQTASICLRIPPSRGGTELSPRVVHDFEGALLFPPPRPRLLIRLRGVSDLI